ncbi:GTPase [Massilia sp.]|uniref:GTPase n=1 Tax=Massilia sp. TaxID=1882437 RepID=UPI0028A0C6E6|nr:GTPase [Massilia sp.]
MRIHNDAQKIRDELEQERAGRVSVALFGQPGAGKSSLINAIVGKKVAQVGVETDKTVKQEEYEHNGLNLVDLPGYGTQKFPKETYRDEFALARFDLFLCVTSGKFHQADTELFRALDEMKKVCIFVVNKHDELWEDGVETAELERRKREDIFKQVGKQVTVIFTSCRKSSGLDQLNTEILRNLDAAKRERWLRGAKAHSVKFLKQKREAAEKYVVVAAGASAANGLNPIPGADIAVDLSVLMKLFMELRECFGLSDKVLNSLKESAIPTVSSVANNVVRYAAKEGILLLFKQFLGRQTLKTISKYVPLIGQAIAASAGFGITYAVGNSYLDDCYTLAEKILQDELER